MRPQPFLQVQQFRIVQGGEGATATAMRPACMFTSCQNSEASSQKSGTGIFK